MERLRTAGVSTSWDFGWNPPLRDAAGFKALLSVADFVFVNEAEAALYARTRQRAAAVRFWRRSSRNTILKLGARGSRWIAHRPLTSRHPHLVSARWTRLVPAMHSTADSWSGG